MYKNLTHNLYNIFYLLKTDLHYEISFLGMEEAPPSQINPVLTIGTPIRILKSFKIDEINFIFIEETKNKKKFAISSQDLYKATTKTLILN